MQLLENFFNNLPLILNILFFLIGLVVLIKSSDIFIDSAVFFAEKFHVSEVIIGLTLVSIGTSLPELATNISAALQKSSEIAIGDITGSNITNIALVAGIGALIMGHITFPKKLLSRDIPLLLGATGILLLFSYFFAAKGEFAIVRLEAIIMLVILILYIIYLFTFNKESVQHEIEEEKEKSHKIKSVWLALLFFIVGIVGIYLGSEVMVRNAIIIATDIHISKAIIGATIIALGTSLPELAVTIAGIVKKKSDISLGNVIGSNIFNILGVLGVTGIISKIVIYNPSTNPDKMIIYWALPLTAVTAIILALFMVTRKKLSRIEGAIFLLIYVGFIVINFTGIPFLFK